MQVQEVANVASIVSCCYQRSAMERKLQRNGFKVALIDLDGRLAGQDAQIVHILHNEIFVEAREGIAGDLAITVKQCMERTFTEIFPDVSFAVNPESRAS